MKTRIVKAIAKGLLLGAALVAAAALSGCTLSVSPDKETFLKAIVILSEK